MVLSHCLGNLDLMAISAMGLTVGRRHFYRVDQDMFLLPESPIMFEQDSVKAALSPRLLLEIDRQDHRAETGWSTANLSYNPKIEA